MRRPLSVVTVLATSAFCLVAGPIPLGGERALAAAAPPPAREGCAWQRHSKRVVKRVVRNGKPRRVVRIKRWWRCRPLSAPAPLAAPPATPAPAPAPAPEESPQPEPGPGPARLSVKATEFAYVLSRPSVVAGPAIVELNNAGEDPHNLNLQREGGGETFAVPEIGSLERATGNFDLAAGSYKLWCSLPEHEELGMTATLFVE